MREETPTVGRHREKVKATVAEALEGLFDGARIMVSGFGLCGNPEALIDGVLETGRRDLTVISNNAGNLGKGLAKWLRAGIVRRVECTYIGNNEDLHRLMAEGKVEVQVMPQGTFVERMRAAGAGLAGFYTPTGVGTVVEEGKEVREFDGRRYLLERPLRADFAFVRCDTADPFGNLRFFGTARNFGPIMAMAAETTIAEADRLVALGEIGPDDVHLPGIFVHRVVHVPEHEDPFEYRTVRPRKEGAR
ncbi:MAG: CoA transferase subunit A [Deltaproteobacteria bacterium]|nr:MAG: CoA transferase subunit A [Deltaproteobacteria bacterium]